MKRLDGLDDSVYKSNDDCAKVMYKSEHMLTDGTFCHPAQGSIGSYNQATTQSAISR